MKNEKALQTGTVSSRFAELVTKEFNSTTGLVKFDDYHKKLCQHMFIKIDAQLQDLEVKRLDKNQTSVTPFTWQNINMQKLAIDTTHRIYLGLDALIPNHISPIPYFNKRKKLYDLDLRIGYVGKDYYRRKMAINKPLDIIYELVYSTDKFKAIKRGLRLRVEHGIKAFANGDSYEFEITNPFDRGNIIGGFGYIRYLNDNFNKLILVSEKEFIKSKNFAQSKTFWENHPEKMRMKTLVHRTTEHLLIDPEKINVSFLRVEHDDNSERTENEMHNNLIQNEIDENANQETIDIEPEEQSEQFTDEEKDEIIQQEINENKPGF